MTLPITFTISATEHNRYQAATSNVSVQAGSLRELGDRLKEFLANLEDEPTSDLVELARLSWSEVDHAALHELARTSAPADIWSGSARSRAGEFDMTQSLGSANQAGANGDERLTIDEIKARYAPDWVLIGEPETNEFQQLQAGRVLYHGPDRDEVTLKAMEYPSGRYAVRFLGTFPKDMEFIL